MRFRGVVLSALIVLLFAPAAAHAWGFMDLYAGPSYVAESTIEDMVFEDVTAVVGGRVGYWLVEDRVALTLRSWYQQSDVAAAGVSPGDLHQLGLGLEVMARYPLSSQFALYGSIGPALLVGALDWDERDDVTLAPAVSAGLGLEAKVGPVRPFIEYHAAMALMKFDYGARAISPRIVDHAAVLGVRVPF